MTTLITGGAGYVGSQMAHAMMDRGDDVIILDNLSTGRLELIPKISKFIEGDVKNVVLVRELIRKYHIQEVMHFAASTSLSESALHPIKYYLNNTANTISLLGAMAAEKVNVLVFSSTAAVYSGLDDLPLSETASIGPITPYGNSKLMSEKIIEDACSSGSLRAGILRYFNVAGADPTVRTGQVAQKSPTLMKALCELAVGLREKVTIFGGDWPTPDGTCIRDFVHVVDLIDAHLMVLDYLRCGHREAIFNCGYGHGVSVLQVVREFESVIGSALNIEIGPRRVGDQAIAVADVSKLRQQFGWTPKFDDLGAIVSSSLKWELRCLHALRETSSLGSVSKRE